MQSGNINRDRTSFSYRQHGVRKTHKLNTNDLFLTSSISGDEVVVQRKGHPTQFLHIDGVDLKKFLERKTGASVYVSSDIYRLYKDSLHDVHPLYIVYPSHTRHSKVERPRAAEASQSQSAPTGDENVSSADGPPPLGLYEWMSKESCKQSAMTK